ncbi:MAG TPA: dihydrofolate reductase [Myxococcota bacterium]
MLTIVAAASLDGVIGRDNGLPWRLPEDLKHFKKTTLGKPVLMGRRTLESIGNKPLPGRTTLLLSTSATTAPAGTHLVRSVDDGVRLARELAPHHDELMVLGGGEVYAHTLPRADKIVLTVVCAHVVGDAHFPPLPTGWVEQRSLTRVHAADDKNTHAMVFLTLWPADRVPAEVADDDAVAFSWPAANFAARYGIPQND